MHHKLRQGTSVCTEQWVCSSCCTGGGVFQRRRRGRCRELSESGECPCGCIEVPRQQTCGPTLPAVPYQPLLSLLLPASVEVAHLRTLMVRQSSLFHRDRRLLDTWRSEADCDITTECLLALGFVDQASRIVVLGTIVNLAANICRKCELVTIFEWMRMHLC